MRDIEFRGYDPDTKRWHYGSYVALEEATVNPWGSTPEDYENNVKHYIFFTESMDWGLPTRKLRATVDPKSVGQYTGMVDKNNKRIYEGDIIHYEFSTVNGDVIVVWDKVQARWSVEGVIPAYGISRALKDWCKHEVIGKAYEEEA